jgi:putative FmdB family regulatory protein
MPLYEYQCDECGHTFEKIQKFSDPLEDTCPKCGGPVRKLMSSPAIQFKGSGFYITDYAKKDSASTKFDSGQSDAPKSDAAKGDGKRGSTETTTSSETKNDTSASKTDAPATASKDAKSS